MSPPELQPSALDAKPNVLPNASESRLDNWIKHASGQDMPVFRQTIQQMSRIISDSGKSLSSVSDVILCDASMTARVLRIANSSYYNLGRQEISTISRAVILLGLDAIKSISASINVIDAMPKNGHRDQVAQEMARAFHAAVQSRAIATAQRDRAPEEVFIQTLLSRLGEITFWCFAGELGDTLQAAMKKPGYDKARAEQEVLGFKLEALTLGLSHQWGLALLETALHPSNQNTPRARWCQLGHDIAEATEKGWDTPETRKICEKAAKLLRKPAQSVLDMLKQNAGTALNVVQAMGVPEISNKIPVLRAQPMDTITTTVSEKPFPEPDVGLQNKILGELTVLLQSKPNLNMLLELVLEGIYRGVGTDRSLFALLTPDRRHIKARFALGIEQVRLLNDFSFFLDDQPFLSTLLQHQRSIWIREQDAAPMAKHMKNKLQSDSFLLAPIVIANQPIGLFYADRQPSGRPLDDASFNQFKHFASQANKGLEQLRR